MKTEETIRLENEIYNATNNGSTFGCFEVTIGIGGKERVDYMTYNTKGDFRCYEIKVSLSDFHSNAKISFVGNFNYYVLTNDLYEKVKDEIPNEVGVYVGGLCQKRAKRQELKVEKQILIDSLIRSFSHNYKNSRLSDNAKHMTNLKRKISSYERSEKRDQKELMWLKFSIRSVLDKRQIEKIDDYMFEHYDKYDALW